MKPLVIFGTGELAEVAHFYFKNDTQRQIAAFTLDEAYIRHESWQGVPVVPFETLVTFYPPAQYDLFIAVGYNQVNKVRRDKYLAAKQQGYQLASYISSKATVWSDSMGDNCFILEDNTIQPFVRIGNNVTLWSGNHIGHHCVINDHCFITSQVVVSGKTVVGEGSFIGVNATLRDHIRIGRYCVIGAGALIMRDTEDESVFSQKRTDAMNIRSSELDKL